MGRACSDKREPAALRRGEAAAVLCREAFAHRTAGAIDEAERLYRDALKLEARQCDALVGLALVEHARGAAGRALCWIDRALAVDPDLLAALNLRAALHFSLGQTENAVASYRAVLARAPDHAEAHHNFAVALGRLGRHDEALAAHQRAVALRPDFLEALNSLAHAYLGKNRPADAEACYRRVIELRPSAAEPLSNLGVALVYQGRSAEAEAYFRRSIELKPDYPDALNNLGLVLKRSGDAGGEAIALYRRALAVNPDFADAMNNLGVALTERGELDEAMALLRRAVERNPRNPEPLNNLGNALIEADRLDDAVACLRRALALRPNYLEALNNLGIALREAGAVDEAVAVLNRALALRPGYPEALLNLGFCWRELGDVDQAVACNQRAIAGRPDLVEAHWNLALAKLLKGEYAEGFKGYEWRFRRAKGDRPRPYRQPRWALDSSRGTTVLIYAEQGLGDTIQFARYVPHVVRRGFKVVLEVQPPLKRLFGGVAGVTALGRGEPLPAFDCHIPLLSLPAAFDTRVETIPSRGAYLRAAESQVAAWRARLSSDGDGFRVGLVWRGNPKHGNDHQRSLDPALLAPLFAVRGLRLYSLQKESREGDLDALRAFGPISDLAPLLEDFSETAAAIAALDLTIAVDTSVAHLAGALGRPIWILVPFSPDWRWMVGREDSPWYGSARLFRQPKPRAWQGAIAGLVGALGVFAANSLGGPRP